jgi:hypothetical protein
LRPDWGPWSCELHISPACIESIYQELPSYSEGNAILAAAFLKTVLVSIQNAPPSIDLRAFEVQIGLFELKIEEKTECLLLGVRIGEDGAIYLAAAEDWSSS